MRYQGGAGEGDGKHPAFDTQHSGRLLDSSDGVASYLGEGGQQEVPEVMTGEAVAGVEPVVEKSSHQVAGLVFRRQGHQTPSKVSGRKVPQFLAQPAGAAATVGHGYHSGEVTVLGTKCGQGGVVSGPATHYYNVFSAHLCCRSITRWQSGSGQNLCYRESRPV